MEITRSIEALAFDSDTRYEFSREDSNPMVAMAVLGRKGRATWFVVCLFLASSFFLFVQQQTFIMVNCSLIRSLRS